MSRWSPRRAARRASRCALPATPPPAPTSDLAPDHPHLVLLREWLEVVNGQISLAQKRTGLAFAEHGVLLLGPGSAVEEGQEGMVQVYLREDLLTIARKYGRRGRIVPPPHSAPVLVAAWGETMLAWTLTEASTPAARLGSPASALSPRLTRRAS